MPEPSVPQMEQPRAVHHQRQSVIVDDLYVEYVTRVDRGRRVRSLLTEWGSRSNQRTIKAVRGVSFTVEPGEAIGIIGRNGSGKSTLLRTIAGLLPPTSGQVYARSIPILLSVGSAMQAQLSGRRNVLLGGTALGFDRREMAERVDEIARFAGLDDFIDMPLRAYSSGMRARLQFSISTIVRPDILMIDEALAVGDEEFRIRSEERIREVMDRAGTVFLVSHGLTQIRKICNRALWLEAGRVRMLDDARQVARSYREATERAAG